MTAIIFKFPTQQPTLELLLQRGRITYLEANLDMALELVGAYRDRLRGAETRCQRRARGLQTAYEERELNRIRENISRVLYLYSDLEKVPRLGRKIQTFRDRCLEQASQQSARASTG